MPVRSVASAFTLLILASAPGTTGSRLASAASRISRTRWAQQGVFIAVSRPFSPSEPKQSARTAIFMRIEETITRSDRWSHASEASKASTPPTNSSFASAPPQPDGGGAAAMTLASDLGFVGESMLETFLLAFGLATGSLVYLVAARVL